MNPATEFHRLINRMSDQRNPINERAIINAARIDAQTVDGQHSDLNFTGTLSYAVLMLAQQLNTERGHGGIVNPNHRQDWLPLGNSSVLVEYVAEEPYPASEDDPGDPGGACIASVFINGNWSDPLQVVSESTVEGWIQQIEDAASDSKRESIVDSWLANREIEHA